MADFNGVEYAKIYVNEPKELGSAGTQDVSEFSLYDESPGALVATDRVAIGILPDESRVTAFSELGGGSITLEDEDANPIALGDKVSSATKLYAVAGGVIAAGKFLVKYLQA